MMKIRNPKTERIVKGKLVRIEKGIWNHKTYWGLFINNQPVTTTNLKRQALAKALEILNVVD